MSETSRQSRCERTREWAALAPDGELSALERRLLDAHVLRCVPCRMFADDAAAIAVELRAAPLQRPALRLLLPPAYVRRSVYARVRAAGAVAAVAAMAFGIAARAPLGTGAGDRPEAPVGAAPAEVDEAELQTIRQLRREALLSGESYPDRPTRTFGNRPA